MPSKKKGQFLPGETKLAVEDVLKHKKSVRKAAKENNVDRTTLARYIKDAKKDGVQNTTFKKSFVTLKLVFFKPFPHSP